jgi:protein phosphatase 2C family protein 2/3
MSHDHKPTNTLEKMRIEKAGGYVEDNRVNGVIALSRAFGDLEYKQEKSLTIEH